MNKKKRNNKLETLLASDASNAQSWIVEGCDDEKDDEMGNDILPPKKGSKNAQVETKESKENDFVLDGTKDELDNEEEYIELESNKELNKN